MPQTIITIIRHFYSTPSSVCISWTRSETLTQRDSSQYRAEHTSKTKYRCKSSCETDSEEKRRGNTRYSAELGLVRAFKLFTCFISICCTALPTERVQIPPTLWRGSGNQWHGLPVSRNQGQGSGRSLLQANHNTHKKGENTQSRAAQAAPLP